MQNQLFRGASMPGDSGDFFFNCLSETRRLRPASCIARCVSKIAFRLRFPWLPYAVLPPLVPNHDDHHFDSKNSSQPARLARSWCELFHETNGNSLSSTRCNRVSSLRNSAIGGRSLRSIIIACRWNGKRGCFSFTTGHCPGGSIIPMRRDGHGTMQRQW